MVQPLLLLLIGVGLIVGLGIAQRTGWIVADGGTERQSAAANTDASVQYICPMMCTPPQSEPGRCPVCGMELVPTTAGANGGGQQSIQIDSAARRIANIRTVPVNTTSLTRTVRAVGELSYDEGSLKTISAYVDGRLEQLYADYTGVVVQKGDRLALLYSPKLYSGQVEFLMAKKAQDRASATVERVVQSRQKLYESARQRLIELGMTPSQLDRLEEAEQANSRMHLHAPISGTVIEKLAVEGQYVKEGQPIYRLADLSTVWLMLWLYPDEAASIRYGQLVQAKVQSLPGETLTGRVAFVDPNVDPTTRTVGVRVVIPNPDGRLRVGDFADATIEAPLHRAGPGQPIYDPELAGKWISPRHPHVIRSAPGQCPVCGEDLVPAEQLGYAAQPIATDAVTVIPRNAVLMAGGHSVVYVETEPGRFELRPVVLGATAGDQIAILQGLQPGEQVASSGNFLIDAQMQLAGNPSLIDPTKAQVKTPEAVPSAEQIAALAALADEDRAIAKQQQICPVTQLPLGSMGVPPKVKVKGRTVLVCCRSCEGQLLDAPGTFLSNLPSSDSGSAAGGSTESERTAPSAERQLPPSSRPHHEETEPADAAEHAGDRIAAALQQLLPADRDLAEQQRICPVTEMALGAMGQPIKLLVQDKIIFLCCQSCRTRLLADPARYLAEISWEATR